MAHSIEITSTYDQISLLPQTEKDEIEEGKKVDHLIYTNGQDPSGSQTKKSLNQIFAKKFKDLDNSSIKSHTMFKANVSLRESNPDAYAPKMISIGPYHKKNPQLHQMEKYKLLYLQRFLGRKKGIDVESCIKELEGLKEEALKCYDGVETDEFCEMLLLDGCFVIEFIRKYYEMTLFEIMNSDICIMGDLTLLENQLPFFVLNKLYLMTKRRGELALAIQWYDLVTSFVGLRKMTHASFRWTESNEGNIKHLLHVLHMSSCHGNPIKVPEHGITYHRVMPNATELSEAGVSFLKIDKLEDNISLFDIKFENGFMTIPCFQVNDITETILRNLIAYEQQSSDVQPKYFSDFSIFMNYLIDSDKDVNLLRRKGIIENWLGDDKEVANLFNKMGTGVTIFPDFYYKEEFKRAVEHCEKPWNRMKANLKHNYFSSPWAGASTVAAIILLILTTIQTILAFTGPIM